MNATHDKLLTQSEVADLLCVSQRTLEGWRFRGHGPAFIQISPRCIRYRTSDVMAFVERKRHLHTSQYNSSLTTQA